MPAAPPGVVMPPPRCNGRGGGGLGVLGAPVDNPGVPVDPKLIPDELGVDDGVGVCVILSFDLGSINTVETPDVRCDLSYRLELVSF